MDRKKHVLHVDGVKIPHGKRQFRVCTANCIQLYSSQENSKHYKEIINKSVTKFANTTQHNNTRVGHVILIRTYSTMKTSIKNLSKQLIKTVS